MALLADFHNHSCLSPCGSLDLSPRVLVELAASRGIQVLALTDHNSSLNCPAFGRLCPRFGIIPLFGMEATTAEEIHVLCLFNSAEASLSFSEYAYSLLFPLPNDPEKTGDQVYVDEEDNILGEVEYFLPSALDLSIDAVGDKVRQYGGLVIPAHVDRPAFSMFSQLGAVVPGSWAAVECVRIPPVLNGAGGSGPSYLDTLGYPLITSSDAHYPEHVARRPFELDIRADELAPRGPEGPADLAALEQALSRRKRFQNPAVP
ncbi:MAG: PHP domain-containing protein [Treponema sp.]|jgi:PHP family Zn ribbon phosphoesterase|nr:PHP domain-containing protein [Treponema sp.]